jgi:hypothetical protein
MMPEPARTTPADGHPPRHTILSLGAGVQSTTLALLAARGELALPEAAIFADTGWEPLAVYQNLEWLRGQLAGTIPVHVVRKHQADGRPAHIRADTLARIIHRRRERAARCAHKRSPG